MVSILLAIFIIALIPFVAFNRVGHRGVYAALALVGLVGGAGCMMLIPSRGDIATAANEAQRAGAGFLFEYGPPLTVLWFAFAFGSLLGALTYRAPLPRA